MKIRGFLLFFCLALGLNGAARAEDWAVRMKAVHGRDSYERTQASPVGKQANYVGKALVRGGGPAREIILNTYLHEPEEGLLRLDYQVEVGGGQAGRPPFQVAGKIRLRPGKQVLAAGAGGWKLILELQGEAEGETSGKGSGTLEASLKCGRVSYPVSFVYLPDEQYSAVLYTGDEDAPRKFMAGLLPKSSGVDGTFLLQYALQLKEGSRTLVSNNGELVLAPGEGKQTAAAGKGCVFSAKALR